MDVAGAQHIVVCSLCPQNTVYFCNSCHDKLCQECKEKHSKSNASRHHKVVWYHEKVAGERPEPDMCAIHPDLINMMYCLQCDVRVCTKCIAQIHQGHKLTEFKDNDKEDRKASSNLVETVKEVATFPVPELVRTRHISCVNSEVAWISDGYGNLILTNLQCEELHRIQTCGGLHGYHTIMDNKELLYADWKKRCIKVVKSDKKVLTFIKTGEWEPVSVFYSTMKQEILVGVRNKQHKCKIVRYNISGQNIQEIESNHKNKPLYHYPCYITENSVNSDICTSDWNLAKSAVIVVDSSGTHRFSYYGQSKSQFYPCGICTDIKGNILVSDQDNHMIHLLDLNGNFLLILLIFTARNTEGMSLDVNGRLWCGLDTTVSVYTYLLGKSLPISEKTLQKD